MKRFFIIQILISLIITSCNTAEDYFRKFNEKPEITVRGINDADFSKKESDSAKVNTNYILYYKITDAEEENLKVQVAYDHAFTCEIFDDKVIIVSKSPAKGKIRLFTKDSFDAMDEVIMELKFFDNQPPVAILEIEDIPDYPFEKILNGSESYDPDSSLGGNISLYRFLVNGKEIEKTYHSSIKYTFPESKEYKVGLAVRDNNGVWSQITYKTIKID